MLLRCFKIVLSFAMMASSLTGSSSASAQATDPGVEANSTPAKSKRKAPPKVIELEELIVEGRIQKPEVFYVLGRADTRYQATRSRESFLKSIDESVKENPF